eukprot:7062258-Prymnesium_polylepis.1
MESGGAPGGRRRATYWATGGTSTPRAPTGRRVAILCVSDVTPSLCIEKQLRNVVFGTCSN